MTDHKEIIDTTKSKGVIYMLTSPSKKSYIGQSVNFKNRYSKYKCGNAFGKLKKALDKYGGVTNFDLVILDYLDLTENRIFDKKLLNQLEIDYIRKHNTVNLGYNTQVGGDSYIPTKETRKKLSEIGKLKEKKELSKVCVKCSNCGTDIEVLKIRFSRKVKKNNIRFYCSKKCTYTRDLSQEEDKSKISKETKQQIIELYLKLKYIKLVSKEVGVSVHTISKILKKNNIVVKHHGGGTHNTIKKERNLGSGTGAERS